MQTFKTGAVAVLVALLLASGASAQEASPEGEPLPYGDYLAELEEFAAASSATTDHLGPASTVADLVAAFEESVALVRADQRRMLDVVPEPCYAVAHEEVVAYRETAIELFDETLPLMAEAGALMDVVPLIEAMDVELLARHATAYVEDPDRGGFRGDYRNILSEIATCDVDASPQPSGASPAIAQERSPPPWFGGRVEMPEYGFAVTVPARWIAFDMTGDVESQARTVAAALYPDASVDVVHLVTEEFSGIDGAQLGLLANSLDSACGFGVASGGPEMELGALADLVFSSLSNVDSVTDLERPRAIELSAGPGFLIAASLAESDDPADLRPVVLYLVERAAGSLLMVTCAGHDPPDDDWLSIAETFEFLPAGK